MLPCLTALVRNYLCYITVGNKQASLNPVQRPLDKHLTKKLSEQHL